MGACSAKDLQALLTTVSEDHVIALPTEERVEEVPDARLIIIDRIFAMQPLRIGQLNKVYQIDTREEVRRTFPSAQSCIT